MSALRVVVVDDDRATVVSLERLFQSEGHEVVTFTDGNHAWEEIEIGGVDVVVTDVVMPALGGLELLERIVSKDLATAVILVTGYGDIPTAVEAVKKGAFDFIPKPVDPERLCLQVATAGKHAQLARENRTLRSELAKHRPHHQMIGQSPPMMALRDQIERAADVDATVLITGESGSGKELVARQLVASGTRRKQSMVVVNCAAVPSTLVESEFFGHEKGAFTGAVGRRRGRFELAHRGTLFLDEIGDIDATVQAKLLRVIQERSFERVGGTATVNVDVRIITATRFDLAELVKEERFREDLFYRLSVIHLKVPPLRERAEDIPVLAKHFANEMAALHGRQVPRIANEALAFMRTYAWPGNIRELRNCLEGMVAMSTTGEIGVRDLPAQLTGNGRADDFHFQSLGEIERDTILATLAALGGNRKETARVLGIGLKTLYRRLHDFGILGGDEPD